MNSQKDPGSTSTPTKSLASFASNVAYTKLAEHEKHETLRHLLDTLGACAAGIEQPIVQAVSELCRKNGVTQGDVPVIGSTLSVDVLTASYLMAAAGHALEMDDGNREGSIHPGTVVVPAALAMAHRQNVDADTLLSAVIAGYEVAVSIAECLHPHASKRGFQTTPVAGTLGAAAAAGRVLGLDPNDMESALGIAASSSSGIFAYLSGGGNIKKLHPAHAAREGVFAALLAQQGIVQGPRNVAETRAGVLQAFGGLEQWTGKPESRQELAVVRSYLKPYPCCRHIHPAIDALLRLRIDHGLQPGEVAGISVGTYEAAMPHASLPWDTLNVAQLSFPYVMAVAMLNGAVDLPAFSPENRNDESVARLAAKVSVHVDPECNALYPANGPARVTVTLNDGSSHELFVPEPIGSPDLPLSDQALVEKFCLATTQVLSRDDAHALAASSLAGNTLPDARALMRILAA